MLKLPLEPGGGGKPEGRLEPGVPVMLFMLPGRATLAGSTMMWHVHGSWMQRSGAFNEHVKPLGHDVAHGGISA
jgi:hypothetical protein